MRDPAAEHGQCERYAYGESHRDRCVCCRAIVSWFGWRVQAGPRQWAITCGSFYCVSRVERTARAVRIEDISITHTMHL